MRLAMKNLALIGCCLLLCCAGGCGKGGRQHKGAVEITYGTWESTPHQIKYIEQVARNFEKKNPGIIVKVVSLDKPEKLFVELAAGTCQDVFFCHYLHLAEMITRGNTIMPIDDSIKQDPDIHLDAYFKPTIRGLMHNGKLYGLPVQTGSDALFYNVDLFKKAGLEPPNASWTLADLLDAAEKLTLDTNGDSRTDQYGLLQPDWQDVLILYGINNSNMFSPNGTKCLLDSQSAIAGMQLLSEMRNKYRVVTVDPQATAGGGLQSFMSGKIAMMFGGCWALREFQKIKSFHWDITQVPRANKDLKGVYPTAAVMANCIWRGSKHKAEAYKFLKYFSSEAGLIEYSKSLNGIPPLKTLAYSKRFLSLLPKHSDVFLQGLDDRQTAPMIKNRSHAYDIIKDGMENVRLGLVSPNQAAVVITQEVDSVIK